MRKQVWGKTIVL